MAACDHAPQGGAPGPLMGDGPRGLVFNVQGFSVHDGPGIRTMVFMKGCPLRCRWCSNPESQSPLPEPALNPGRCLGLGKCGLCLPACPAISAGPGDLPSLDRRVCRECPDALAKAVPRCGQACPARALVVHGRPMGAAGAIAAVERDSVFQARSGGGLTLTGGEPLAQGAFALALLGLARSARVGAAMETSGQAPYGLLREAAARLDFLLYDLKSADPAKHLEYVGAGPETIMGNLISVCRDFPDLPVTVRTPVVPGFNDDRASAEAIGYFLREVPGVSHEALPYHAMGAQKYAFLGRTYEMGDVALGDGALEAFRETVATARRPGKAARQAAARRAANVRDVGD